MPLFLSVLLVWTSALLAPAKPGTSIIPNDNRAPAGVLRNGTLELQLEARMGSWSPEKSYGPALQVPVFAEVGKSALNPGPLIRVREGTNIHVTLHNTLNTPLNVFGLCKRPCGADSLRILPGNTADVRFEAGAPGTYMYWAVTHDEPIEQRNTDDGQLQGGFIVDARDGQTERDRIFVISVWNASKDVGHALFAVNGLSWPHTERLTYTVGDSIHWRVINATLAPHPMHLHGFYYRVDSKGTTTSDTTYAPEQRRMVVTEALLPITTMSMTWSPDRSGNWPFHCHMISHIKPDQRMGRPVVEGADAHRQSALVDMAGLMMGVYVKPNGALKARPEGEPVRMRLLTREVPGKYGTRPGLSWVLQRDEREPAADSLPIPGSPIVLMRGQPYTITVVNHTHEAVSTHWHGMELESYYDGVSGLSGDPAHLAPMIDPQDSFVVHFTPRRAGTFIYHTHMDESGQLGSGLFGALLVVEPGETIGPNDRILLFNQGGPDEATARVELNGKTPADEVVMKAGTTYHLRVINITPSFNMNVALMDAAGAPLTWRPISKDGMALPDAQQSTRGSAQRLLPGETYDFDFTPANAGYLRLQVNARHVGQIRNFFVPVRVTD